MQGSKYSNILIPTFIFKKVELFEEILKNEITSNLDARDLNTKKELIICDPPYGFNTDEDEIGLAKLYDEFLEKSIKNMQPFGQLIICLPAESYTGRDLPYCTRSNLVSRQIVLKAQKLGRQIYIPAKSLPHKDFNAPYYWESEKALKRIILHFCFI